MKALWLEERTPLVSARTAEAPQPPPGEATRARAPGRHLQHRPGAGEGLLPVHRRARPRVRGPRGAGAFGSRVGRAARGRRDQRRVRRVRDLPRRPTHPLRATHGARHPGRHGAFARAAARCRSSNLHAVPDGVPDEAACFTEPLAAALQVQEQVPVRPEDRVVVVGAGKLGRLVALTLKTSSSRRPRRRPGRVTPARRSPRGPAHRRHEGSSSLPKAAPIVVVECTGNPEGLALATRAVRPRGTIVLKSTYHGEAATLDVSRLVVNEVTLVGSRCGPFAPGPRSAGRRQGRGRPARASGRFPLRDGLRRLRGSGATRRAQGAARLHLTGSAQRRGNEAQAPWAQRLRLGFGETHCCEPPVTG